MACWLLYGKHAQESRPFRLERCYGDSEGASPCAVTASFWRSTEARCLQLVCAHRSTCLAKISVELLGLPDRDSLDSGFDSAACSGCSRVPDAKASGRSWAPDHCRRGTSQQTQKVED